MCPGSSDPLYIVTYYIKWVTTSGTHSSIVQGLQGIASKMYVNRKLEGYAALQCFAFLSCDRFSYLAKPVKAMVFISDGNSGIGAHVRRGFGYYLRCFRLLLRSKAVTNPIFL